MPGQINPSQRIGVTAWRGTVTKDNHIYSLFAQNPQKASDVMTVLFSSMHLPTVNTYLSQEVPVREYEDDSELFYDVVTSANRNIPLVEARYSDGTPIDDQSTDNAGIGFQPFYLVFPEDWFALGEILWGSLNEVYPLIVKEHARIEGTNYVYLVEPFGANGGQGVPAKLLQPGERFSWGYAPVEDNFSRKVGDIRFSTPVAMSGEFSRVRIQHKIGGKELGKRLAANIPLTSEVGGRQVTKTVSRWMLAVTWKLEETFEKYKSNALERGVSTKLDNGEYSNFGLSGLPNKQGSGLREYQNAGNVQYYDKFDLSLLENALGLVSEGKIDFKQRKFVIRTGERGLRLINKAIKSDMSGWTPVVSASAPSYITSGPEAAFTNGNAITVKDFQVTRWISSTGLDVTLMLDSSKDDAVTNKIMHPLGGTAESYRMDICYAGDEEQPNVQKCVVKGEPDRRGYQWGPFYNPFTGQANNMNASYDEDSAVAHMKATLGLIVYDPTRCISLIPNILMA